MRFSNHHYWHEKEKRLVQFASNESIPDNLESWRRDERGAAEMLHYFQAKKYPEVTERELREYIYQLPEDERKDKHLFTSLYNEFQILASKKTVTPNERKAIDRTLLHIKQWNAIVKNAQLGLSHILTIPEEVDELEWGDWFEKPIEVTGKKIYEPIRAFGVGFANANGTDKVVMLAGAAASVVLAKKIFFNKATRSKWGKKILGWGIGVPVIYMGLNAVNRTAEKSFGRPLISMKGGIFTGTSAEEYQAAIQKEEQENQRKKLEDDAKKVQENLMVRSKVPADFLREIQDGDTKYTVGLANLLSMTVDDLRKLYITSQGSKSIDFKHRFYPKTFEAENGSLINDELSPTERFELVHDVADTLKLLEPDESFTATTQEMRKQSLIYLAITYLNT